MINQIDSYEEIVVSKLAYLLKKYSNQVIRENGDGQNFLKCCGLSSLLEQYNDF